MTSSTADPDRVRPVLGRLVERLPGRLAGVTLADHDPGRFPAAAKAHAAADAYLAGEIANLVLVGPPGVGKTMLAAGICRALAERSDDRFRAERAAHEEDHDAWREAMQAWVDAGRAGAPPEAPRYPAWPSAPSWVNVPTALVELRREFGSDERPVTEELHGLRSGGATLVLDDLGREKASDWTADVIYVLLNGRYESQLRTVVTSNLTMAELAESPYWPSVSRLAEDGRVVEVTGPDQRLRRR